MPEILPVLQRLFSCLSKTQIRQLHRIVSAMLVQPGRATQLDISRWTGKGGSYRTVHRFFQSRINWTEVQCAFVLFFMIYSGDTYLLAGDETVVGKAGKRTHGVEWFYSSIAQKAVPGVAIFSFALVNVRQRKAYPLCSEQVRRTKEEKELTKKKKDEKKQRRKKPKSAAEEADKRKRGRPKGSKNKNKSELVLSPELQRILLLAQRVMALIGKRIPLLYLALDGHFGNPYACQMARQLGLHIISKFKVTSALWLPPTAEQKEGHPRLKYGDRLDFANLPTSLCISSSQENGIRTEIYQAHCWQKDFPEMVNVVIVVKVNLQTKRSGHMILFSSDLALEGKTLIDYYSLRFQIEFTFRDAKQHWGLDDFMGVTEAAVTNAIGLSFFMVNLSLYLRGFLRNIFPEAGVNDLKSYYRARRYALEALKLLPVSPDAIVTANVMESISLLGLIHPASKKGETERFSTKDGPLTTIPKRKIAV